MSDLLQQKAASLEHWTSKVSGEPISLTLDVKGERSSISTEGQAVSSIHEPVLVLGHEIESEAEVCQLGESV